MPHFCRSFHILLVEDSAADVLIIQEALTYTDMLYQLHVVTDGVDALAFLRQEGRYVNMPRPDLILLDLNLPKKDGREVLAEMKTDSRLKTIPVIILTTSKAEEDILTSYELGANCYITKPMDFPRFVEVVQAIQNFWFTIVSLPPE